MSNEELEIIAGLPSKEDRSAADQLDKVTRHILKTTLETYSTFLKDAGEARMRMEHVIAEFSKAELDEFGDPEADYVILHLSEAYE